MSEGSISSFFSDFELAFGYFLSFFNEFLSKALSYPVTYYAVFMIIFAPMFVFLLCWLFDFLSDGISSNTIGRFNALPPNVYYKEKQGLKGINNLFRAKGKQYDMKRGRIYKTKTLEYKGKKYRYVTSERAPRDFNGNFNTDDNN